MAPTSIRILASCILLLAVGCSSGGSQLETGKVAGIVLSNDKPVPKGVVGFYAQQQGIGARAKLNEDGTFTIDTELPIGEYVVTISPPDSPAPKEGPPTNPKDYPHIPAKYHRQPTSDLTAMVKAGDNQFEFKIQQ